MSEEQKKFRTVSLWLFISIMYFAMLSGSAWGSKNSAFGAASLGAVLTTVIGLLAFASWVSGEDGASYVAMYFAGWTAAMTFIALIGGLFEPVTLPVCVIGTIGTLSLTGVAIVLFGLSMFLAAKFLIRSTFWRNVLIPMGYTLGVLSFIVDVVGLEMIFTQIKNVITCLGG